MPLFLDFSPEVICSILDHLAPDSRALDALCLAGNHNLLALTRPYTWMEVNMVLGAEGGASSRTAERLKAFIADPAKVGATRSLNIRLVGPYICRMPAILLLIENLGAFVNVTHASFCCIRSRNVWGWQTPGRLVRHAVEVLSSLTSITVVGCNAEIEKELENMKDFREESEPPLPVPKLTHVATRFCHPTLAHIWQQCRNVRVLEMEGGDPEDFWRRTVATEKIPKITEDSTDEEIQIAKSLSKFWGYNKSESGLSYLLSGPYYRDDDDDDDEDYIVPFDVAERINIKSEAPPDEDMLRDVYSLTGFFENVDSPPGGLKELAISMAFDVKGYRTCLHGMRGPMIERLGIVLSYKGHWATTEFDQFVADLKNSEQNDGTLPFFSTFESLAEFSLPCDGVSVASMDILAELLSHAPALQHLRFDTADDPHLLSAAAQKYSECILTLVSVSWTNQTTFEIKRSGGVEVLRKTYAAPMWQEWRGIGKWWEM